MIKIKFINLYIIISDIDIKMGNKYSTTTIIGGSCDQEYETVKQMFVKNFITGIFVSNNHLKCIMSKRHFVYNY